MNDTTKKVVVGYNDSEESNYAVRWAAQVARRREAPLLVVSSRVWDEPIPALRDSEMAAQAVRLSEDLASKGADIARQEAADITINIAGVQSRATDALRGYSSEAQLVVVGHQSRSSRLRGVLSGSVALAVSRLAKCPVAVVRGSQHTLPTTHYPSIVAIDGSGHSDAALMLAARWAFETRTLLRIVMAWTTTFLDYDIDEGQQTAHASQAATDIMQAAVAKVIASYPKLQIEPVTAQGRAAEVIVQTAADASLIIMGARGRGSLASLLLGSVSREVVEQAHCPVYIVR